MLNKRPIFIVGFQHGGTNIVLNWLRTHPDVCSPWGETHEVFRSAGGGTQPLSLRIQKLAMYLPIVLVQREIPFNDRNWHRRRQMPRWLQRYTDWIVYKDKFRARGDSQYRYKAEGVEYTDREIAQSRTLFKCTNGDIFQVDIFNEMYPDATFLGLVRNGFAVVEGHLRRKYSLDEIARNYERGIQQILHYSEELPNFHIVRFENVLNEPLNQLERIYTLCGLDIGKITKVRMETKAVINKAGEHTFIHGTSHKVMIWMEPEQIHSFLDPSVTKNQIRRLTEDQLAQIRALAGKSLQQLGYVD